MTHSAYGYGNETVLCNDPHANPLTDLDNADLVQKAWDRTNIDIKICRIGPWVFPIEVTTCFLPKGWLGIVVLNHYHIYLPSISMIGSDIVQRNLQQTSKILLPRSPVPTANHLCCGLV